MSSSRERSQTTKPSASIRRGGRRPSLIFALSRNRNRERGQRSEVCFFNRDHIISVVVRDTKIVVTTTAGDKITIPVATAIFEKFIDELANHVATNFVSIAAAR